MTERDWNDRGAFTEADFAEVRARVMTEVRRRRRHAWMAYGAAAAALVVIVSSVWIWRASRVPETPIVAHVTHPAPPPAPPPRLQPAKRSVHPARRRVAPPKPAPEPQEPLLVKLETPDPDVVIYWIVEPKGDSE